MPAQQGHWIATAYLESGTISRGQVACLNAAGTRYVLATDTNRASADRRSACIALSSADADDPSGSGFEAQYVGVVSPAVSGLGAGTASLIRVSTSGALERTASYSASDDVCGHCDEDGTAYVCFPLIGLSASIGAAAPGAPDYSVQYRATDGTFGGASHASISSDGYFQTKLGSESVASSGLWRAGYAPGTLLAVLDSGGNTKSVIGHTTSTVSFGGTSNGFSTTIGGQGGVVVGAGTGGTVRVNCALFAVFPDNGVSQLFTIQPTVVNCGLPRIGGNTAWGASEGQSTVTSTGTYTLVYTEYQYASQVFTGGAIGTYTYPAPSPGQEYTKFLHDTGGYARTITTGSGTTYSLAANGKAWAKFTASGVFAIDDGGGGGEGAALTIVDAESDIDLGTGADRVTSVIVTSATIETYVELNTIVAPDAGRTGRVIIVDGTGGYARILHNDGTTAANRISTPSGTTYTLPTYGSVELVYNHNQSRWVFVGKFA